MGRARAAFLRFEHVPVDRAIIESAATLDPIEAARLYGLTVESPGA